MIRPPPSSTLFPSPPLSRSAAGPEERRSGARREAARDRRDRDDLAADEVERRGGGRRQAAGDRDVAAEVLGARELQRRSEEHTSELQSLRHIVCRLLLEKKK